MSPPELLLSVDIFATLHAQQLSLHKTRQVVITTGQPTTIVDILLNNRPPAGLGLKHFNK